MPVIQIPKFIVSLLLYFKSMFSKPQFKNFQTYIIGLIINLEGRNVYNISRATLIYNKNQSSLKRYLTESFWENDELQKTACEIFKEGNFRKSKKSDKIPKCILILDDIY